MLFKELFETEIVVEYGKHGFPGYGQGVFRQAAYEVVASWIAEEQDEAIRLALGEWFSHAFAQDANSFKPDLFMKWVREQKRGSRSFNFQQRHFWYLARLIKDTADREMAEYMAHWLGKKFDYNNERFRNDLWLKECGFPS